ncbi:DNA gyrase inhibitor [Actinocatenispora thailandica]|uniref:DNA gyrase inhibitor n=2 Tax=Actinocatenispora thailandica TaxID=227318 RepID=A0A7R7HW87_9ACTN|nr:DNA gyrase inhibitor [Actinocatenispora thailandica]
MHTLPQVVHREPQPYVGISGAVTMRTVGAVADRIPALFGWLAARGVPPAGAPFLRYLVIDMDARLRVEAGVPVATPVPGDGEVRGGELPGGRYATLDHVGRPDDLVPVTAWLLGWAAGQGLSWDMTADGDGERWGCRLEHYQTDPAEQPDLNQWRIQLAFRLRDRATGTTGAAAP